MATSVLYRKSSGEVIKISTKGQVFNEVNATYFGYLIDPSLPDGVQNRELLPDGTLGPVRELGFQKIAIPASDLVRNATQGEIDNFESFKVDDDNIQDATAATSFLNSHKRFRKIFKAILKLIVQELLERSNVKQNAMIDQWNQFKVDIGNAGNLNDIKVSVAALPEITSNLPETTTLTIIKNQLESLIDKDD
jgi:hypothetical protein